MQADDLPWDLKVEGGKVVIRWRHGGPDAAIELGPEETVCDKIVGFLVELDYGEDVERPSVQ